MSLITRWMLLLASSDGRRSRSNGRSQLRGRGEGADMGGGRERGGARAPLTRLEVGSKFGLILLSLCLLFLPPAKQAVWVIFSPLHQLFKICSNALSLGTEGVFPIFLGKSSERTGKKHKI